jgi:hypothetical protein
MMAKLEINITIVADDGSELPVTVDGQMRGEEIIQALIQQQFIPALKPEKGAYQLVLMAKLPADSEQVTDEDDEARKQDRIIGEQQSLEDGGVQQDDRVLIQINRSRAAKQDEQPEA